MKILISLADADMRFMMERILTEEGHEVVSTGDPDSTVKASLDYGPSMLILGSTMKSGGVDLAQKIRSLERTTKKRTYMVLAVPVVDVDETSRALVLGVNDFIALPYSRERLMARVNDAKRFFAKLHKEGHKEEYDVTGSLGEDHIMIRKMASILEILHERMEGKVPEDILKWCASTVILVDQKMHHKKEALLTEALVNRLVEMNDDFLSEISNSLFAQIEEEHRILEGTLAELESHLSLYLMSDDTASKRVKQYDGKGSRELVELQAIMKKEDLEKMKKNLVDYLELIRSHMFLEDKGYFRFAERHLSHEDKDLLKEKFEENDKEVDREGLRKTLDQISGGLKIGA